MGGITRKKALSDTRAPGSNFVLSILLFSTDAFETGAIGLAVHELPGISITFRPNPRLGVLNLGAPALSSVTVSVTCWWICSHNELAFC